MIIKINSNEINEITLRKTKKERKKERRKETKRNETKLVPSPSLRKQMTFCGN